MREVQCIESDVVEDLEEALMLLYKRAERPTMSGLLNPVLFPATRKGVSDNSGWRM